MTLFIVNIEAAVINDAGDKIFEITVRRERLEETGITIFDDIRYSKYAERIRREP